MQLTQVTASEYADLVNFSTFGRALVSQVQASGLPGVVVIDTSLKSAYLGSFLLMASLLVAE